MAVRWGNPGGCSSCPSVGRNTHLRACCMSDTETFRLESERDRVILTFLPHLNKIPWSDIEQVGSQVVAKVSSVSAPKVVVDLSPLDYMGSAQVALVVRIYKVVKERQGTLIVSVNHPVVQEVLTLAGLHKIWTMVRSRDEALARLGVASSGGETGSPLLVLLGSVCALAALLALGAVLGRVGLPPFIGILAAIACSGLAFVLGLLTTIQSQGSRQMAGIGVLLGGVALLSGSMYALASSANMVAQTTPATEETEAGDAGDAVAAQPEGREPSSDEASEGKSAVVPAPSTAKNDSD